MTSIPDPTQLTHQELEQETDKMVCAMATRNIQIGGDVIACLRDRLTLQDLAGIVLVGLERLVWLDSTAFVWAIEHLLPADIVREIHRITAVHIGKQLVDRGFTPGQDFSLNSAGQLLLSDDAREVVTRSAIKQSAERNHPQR